MTSLAHQLKRLALPQSDPNLLTRKEVASLLFDPKDAASMDRSTFYALGCTGLEELMGIEPAFLEFQDTLFSRFSLTMERSVQSKEVNLKLDADISLFLTRLCPYFLLKPAHKCIEWLVHRFHVQLYNTDSLLACALPYHDTNVFVRVLQLLKIKDPTSRWSWLHPLQKAGVPLARGTLITHCYSDLSFMDFICTLVTRTIQAYSGHSETGSQLRVIFSFYISTIVPSLDAVDKVSDTIVAKLLPYIQKGLKSCLVDYKAATYMIVCQLAVKVVMEAGLVDVVAVHISKSLVKEPVLAKEGVASLIVLLQNQKDGAAGPRAFIQLCSMPALVMTLQIMATGHDVSPLLRYLLPHVIRAVFSTCPDQEDHQEAALLKSILQSVPLTKDLDHVVARLLLDEYLSQTELCEENLCTLNQRLSPLVQLFESKYCGALDTVLTAVVTNGMGSEQKRLFHQFLSLSLSSGKYQILGESDTSLLLSLNHPQPVVRALAVDRLMNIVICGQQLLDEAFLKDAVLDRLKDDVPEVVSAALKVLEVLLDVLDAEDAASCLLSVLCKADLPEAEHWLSVLMEAVRLLSHPSLGKGSSELVHRLAWKLLPFSVITTARLDSAQFRIATYVSRTAVLAQHPLTLDWAQELEQVMKKSCEPNFVMLANQVLISTLTRNLSKVDHFSKRDILEKLVLVVEQQQGSDLRQRTSFLVLTQTLLLSLRELNQTQHLLIAQRIFSLLERPLVEFIKHDHDNAQEAVNLVSVSASFCDTLAVYLHRCEQQPGETLDSEYTAVLIALLKDFITFLRCHDTSFKAEAWWNPEKMDTNTCCYLGLICRIFSIIISGTGHGPMAVCYRELMRLLVQVHLQEPLTLFKFLCLLWGYGSNPGDQLDIKVDVVLQTQALYVGGALLGAQSPATLSELAAANSPVVPSLLGCLSSPIRDVRRAALRALQSLSAASSPHFQPIIQRLVKNTEEIIADPSYLSMVFGVLHDEQKKKKKKNSSIQQVLQSIQITSCPSYSAACLLRALSQVREQSVLSALLPVLARLLEQSGPESPTLLCSEAQLINLILGKYDDASGPLLATDPACLDLFLRALRTSAQSYPHIASCQITALEQITKAFFSAVGNEEVQQKLLTAMIDLLLESKNPLVANTVSSVFKGLAVDCQLLANELAPPAKPKVSVSVQQTRRNKLLQRKTQDSGNSVPEGGTVPWQRVNLILELVQHKKKLKRAELLVPVLFSLLSRSLESDDRDLEYSKQLLLSCLLNICNKVSPDVLDEDKFSVELVVQCIRTSDTPQTHHQALLLLGVMATIFPEKVLHNIMSIFTFMGASVLRLDDAYSFRVIDRTVQMVIPALIKAHQSADGQPSSHLDTVVTRIMQVFTDALPHMPEHRRLPVLAQLVTTLGPAQYLWVLMLLQFKLHATQVGGSVNEKDAALERDVDFWIGLCCQFEVSDQLASLIHILVFLLQLPQDKDEVPLKSSTSRGRSEKKKEEKMEDLIFSVEAHSSKELRHLKFLGVSFVAQLLGSVSFIGKVAGGTDDDDESVQQLQQRLLEEILHFIRVAARCAEENANKPTAKFWKVLLNKSYDALNKANALLPADTFITVMRGLMGNELASIRRKAMELLNSTLQHKKQWEEPQVTALLQLTGDLLGIITKAQGKVAKEEEVEHAINRQTALYSLKLLCRHFGASHQDVFVPVLLQSLELITCATEDKNVTGSALLCIAEVVMTLKALAIPHLPRLMPVVLHTLGNRKQLLTNEIYLLSALTALQRIVETLTHFISPYLQETVLQVCRLTCLVGDPAAVSSSSSVTAQLSVCVTSLRNTLATKLPSRVLLATLTKCYSSLVTNKTNQVGALMSFLKEHISHMDKDQLSVHQSELTTFFLTALDFRAENCQGNLQTTAEMEFCVIDCLLAMVMKLSEVTFRLLFFKLFDWSKSESNSKERLLTFYRLADSIAERLKGLFVLFAGHLVKPLADVLQQTNVSKTDESLFEGDGGVEKSCLLLQYVLDCLYKIFLYDSQRFLSKERADTLLGPLVDQLENTLGEDLVYQQRVSQQLVPCIAQFSVAMADDAAWKTLNYQVLLKTRHTSAKVRFSSLLVLKELAAKLKENYMVLLPETIPFLAELMEDECEEVEQQVQTVLREMENILGEPLQSYF
ncbi:HEAT repeat-containing protein 1 isoform X2 [Thalassophryne amazonica]|uniref:HEAT repeat-containing protein 1 isoform X2 n=1 Tax=Thalassophryne amazonica TaxID=390379 RepID=UPI001471D1F6|nr:HEAT repeat-containing protein 1 isoform X2 [Thalassophryne amazonica]